MELKMLCCMLCTRGNSWDRACEIRNFLKYHNRHYNILFYDFLTLFTINGYLSHIEFKFVTIITESMGHFN